MSNVAKNLNTWKHKTEAAKAKIKSKATDYVRRQVKQAYKTALRVSPQWSGNYAYNWFIEVPGNKGAYDRRFKVLPFTAITNPKQAGDREAIEAAEKHLDDMLKHVKWNSNVRLVNYAPVAPMIEQGLVKLRDRNRAFIGSGGVIAYLEFKYKFLKNL